MRNDLMRFSVAMPEDLLVKFDRLVARRGLAKNRSEVVRDLVREALVEDECSISGRIVMGTLTIVYSHHANDLQEKLHHIQHHYLDVVISSTHVHVDEDNCLEVIIMKGETGEVQDIGNLILGTKGVKTGRLVMTTTGQFI
ncbi:MAG: nickel-responsive transcriptional regulator NikR [Coriobacteriia bacterium]|nr:nickel-responsive transcriptional regulator NikR [Coriobacteriia bacterium]